MLKTRFCYSFKVPSSEIFRSRLALLCPGKNDFDATENFRDNTFFSCAHGDCVLFFPARRGAGGEGSRRGEAGHGNHQVHQAFSPMTESSTQSHPLLKMQLLKYINTCNNSNTTALRPTARLPYATAVRLLDATQQRLPSVEACAGSVLPAMKLVPGGTGTVACSLSTAAGPPLPTSGQDRAPLPPHPKMGKSFLPINQRV